ncbi:3',5'-cyclic adenosine monophosphate phosphodiesterase CpdA [Roseobacter fucihabitans]|uniref:3',5'-cyclic adenosine monophosphate phosphodiesterase CpdA n=1 Tax=Roseobacter fucihabitans TaxID=1537242 RepID=A0ABZ2BX90_9RHOB|nr:phosphodiesterase [Roseobacter litoralis]MBC6967512.1 3',5'-cyclic adenosine monophosphate phosphodiesterase CpdA [Roseobacter litoralis]
MSAILQITDTHIVREGALVSNRLETDAALMRLLDRIQSIRHQIGPLDAVVVSGDVSDDGKPESYARFKALIAPLDVPLLVIPGNHDAREPMRVAFPEQFAPKGPLNWVRHMGALTVIGLDTLVEGSSTGTLDATSLAFLEAELVKAANAPILLALHHPPFLSGMGFMDEIGLANRDAFCDLVSNHIGPMRIICGHIHTMMVADVGGHIAISAPSPCSTIAFDQRPDAPVGFMALEDGCLLHKWDAGFQTIRIGPDAGPGPFPF